MPPRWKTARPPSPTPMSSLTLLVEDNRGWAAGGGLSLVERCVTELEAPQEVIEEVINRSVANFVQAFVDFAANRHTHGGSS